MKKFTMPQVLTMGLIGLMSFNLVGVMSASLLAHPVACCTATKQTHLLSSNNFPEFIWPTQGFISRGFSSFHEGIDIAEGFGTPILAAGDGEVIFAGQDDWGLGLVVQLRHRNGSVTVYGHNRRLLVRQGQQVSQGQIIAEMGSTGNSNGSHLHFEVHPNGHVLSGAVNPLGFLPPLVAGKIPPLHPVAVAPRKPKPIVPESFPLHQKLPSESPRSSSEPF